MSEVRRFVYHWFKKKVERKRLDVELTDDLDYFQAGLLDSMGVVLLVQEIEAGLSVRFTDEHFQDRRFATLGGLIEIVQGIKGEEKD